MNCAHCNSKECTQRPLRTCTRSFQDGSEKSIMLCASCAGNELQFRLDHPQVYAADAEEKDRLLFDPIEEALSVVVGGR